METKEHRTINKATWGAGPWQDEPDKRQWQDAATGLPCLLVRNESGGNLCGYVGVFTSHPLHGKDYDVPEVEVHGGLTFAGGCGHSGDESRGICHVPGAGEPDSVWWFGFDCAHAWDRRPAYEARYPEYVDPVDIYRTAAYVEGECCQLAQQLHAAIFPPP